MRVLDCRAALDLGDGFAQRQLVVLFLPGELVRDLSAAVPGNLSQNLKTPKRLAHSAPLLDYVLIATWLNPQAEPAILPRLKEQPEKESGVQPGADKLDGPVPISQDDPGLAGLLACDGSAVILILDFCKVNLGEPQHLPVPGSEALLRKAYHVSVRQLPCAGPSIGVPHRVIIVHGPRGRRGNMLSDACGPVWHRQPLGLSDVRLREFPAQVR